MMGVKRRAMGGAVAAGMLVMLPWTTGCDGFFKCEGKASCPTTTGATNTGNVVFAGNGASTNINAYFVSGGQLFAVAGEPFATSFVPSAMVVTRANNFLYVSSTSGFIYSLAVSSAGVLSSLTQQASTSFPQVAMDVSPDGKWLVALDGPLSTTPAVKVYAIGSGGVLTLESTFVIGSLGGRTVTPGAVRFSPDNTLIAAAMGADGTFVIPFTTTSGQMSTAAFHIATGSNAEGDNALAFDASNNLYIGRATGATATTGIYVAPASTLSAGTVVFAAQTDAGPRSLVFANSYAQLFSANAATNDINGFSVSGGTSPKLTSLGSAVAAPTTVEALMVDSTGKFLEAAGYSATSGLQLYSVASAGAVTVENNAAIGSASGFPVLAATH